MRWINCDFKLLILHIEFICFRFFLLYSKLVSWVLYAESSTTIQFTSREVWKWHVVLLFIPTRISKMEIWVCLGVHLRTDSYSYKWKPKTQSKSSFLEWSLGMGKLCLHSYLPNPFTQAGYDTRSIFKQSLTDLNSVFLLLD